jgi:opacity protein-like surface antigen
MVGLNTIDDYRDKLYQEIKDMLANGDPRNTAVAKTNQGYVFGFGPQVPISGASSNYSHFHGALAVGVDLYNVWRIPIRLEFEGSLPYSGYDKRYQRDVTYQNIDFTYLNYDWPRYLNHTDPLAYPSTDPIEEPQHFENVMSSVSTELKYTIFTTFLNLYIDGRFIPKFTPYIGGGIGLSFIETDISRQIIKILPKAQGYYPDGRAIINLAYVGNEFRRATKKATNFAWHLTFGASYALSKNVDVDFSYRYLNLGYKEKFGPFPYGMTLDPDVRYGATEIDLTKAEQMLLALRFSF